MSIPNPSPPVTQAPAATTNTPPDNAAFGNRAYPPASALVLIRDRANRLHDSAQLSGRDYNTADEFQALAGVVLDLVDVVAQLIPAATQ